MKKKKEQDNTVCRNRKAAHEYHILDRAEAGLVLVGSEVKSVRNHKVSLDGAYARIENGEVWLVGANIEQYKHAIWDHDPRRKRKLLLSRQEIKKFAEKATQKGFTLIPLSIYFKSGRAKVELAVCKGKQDHDKRQAIKKRDVEREMRRV